MSLTASFGLRGTTYVIIYIHKHTVLRQLLTDSVQLCCQHPLSLCSVVASPVTDLTDPIYLPYEVARNLYWAMLVTGTDGRLHLLHVAVILTK